MDKTRVAAADKAAAAFLALTKDAYKAGTPPRQTDPNVKSLLDTIVDTADIETKGPVPFSEVGPLSGWAANVAAVGAVYLLAGTGIGDAADASRLDEKQRQQIANNTANFAPELGRCFDAQVRLLHAVIDSVAAELAAHPKQYQSAKSQGGLAKMRSGLKHTLTGVMMAFVTPRLDAAWMRARLVPLKAIAPAAANLLPEQDRRELADIAKEIADQIADPEVRRGLVDFARAVMA